MGKMRRSRHDDDSPYHHHHHSDKGRGQPPGHHHEPAPTTATASNCSWGGGGVLMDRNIRGQGTADNGNDYMDMQRTTGGGGGERTTGGTKAMGRGRGQLHHTQNRPRQVFLCSFLIFFFRLT
jgi:hypothetical protein